MTSVRDYGAVGDGRADDTEAIQHAIDSGDGFVEFPRGEYRITGTLTVDLARTGRTGLCGRGGTAKLLMEGVGAAVFLKGTHTTTAAPDGFRPEEWQRERMPTVAELEIEGRNEKADGIRIEGVMQPTLTGVLIREVRHAVHATRRARNLLIDGCHFYHNRGVGVFLDGVDQHQTIIADSHISYCRLGGIRIERSAIYNLQITGNDIEYNNNRGHGVPGADAEPTAEIYIDTREGTVREATICSNTIQATYSPNGCNIRIIGGDLDGSYRSGLMAITGNLIGSQTNNIHLTAVNNTTITGNSIYNGRNRNILLEGCRNIVLGANGIGSRPNESCTGVRIVDCLDCTLNGLHVHDGQPPHEPDAELAPEPRRGQVELVRCARMNLSGLQILDSAPDGLYLEDCRDTLVTGCIILDGRSERLMQTGLHWTGTGAGNLIANCRIGRGTASAVVAPDHILRSGNIVDE